MGSIIELFCAVARERRAEGFKHAASGEAMMFRRAFLHPFEIEVCAEASPAPIKSTKIVKRIANSCICRCRVKGE